MSDDTGMAEVVFATTQSGWFFVGEQADGTKGFLRVDHDTDKLID